jgi:hypothetical protein
VVRLDTENTKLPSLEALIASRQVDAWLLCLSTSDEGPDATFLTLDWRFRGAVAKAIKIGAISREPGTVSLLPCTRPVSDSGRTTYQIITLGVRDRKNISQSEITRLTKNIEGLGLKTVGLSASDFGWSIAEAKRHFPKGGAELCVTE